MYERLIDPHQAPLSQSSVGHHIGGVQDFLRRHVDAATLSVQAGRKGVRDSAPYLLHRVGDYRMLRLAWDYLRTRGGGAPGPNNHRYGDFDEQEIRSLLRAIGHAIREGTYRPGPVRRCKISKGSGRGNRTLTLANIEDRVVARAACQTLFPYLDPFFDPNSFGSRPARDRRHALALAERFANTENRLIWIVEDLVDAFDHVPRTQLVDILRSKLPSDELIDLVGRLIGNGGQPGIPQGGASSPLLLNVYLDHFLDRKWRKRHPDIPSIRIVDDLLIPCRTIIAAMSLTGLASPSPNGRKR